MNNENRFKEYRKKKYIKYLMVALLFCVIVLEILALLKKVHYIWGLLVFVLVYLLKKINNK